MRFPITLAFAGFGGCGGGGGGRRTDEIAPDADSRGEDAAAAEGDVLGAVQLGEAGDFVARFGFDPGGLGGGFGGGHFWGGREEGMCVVEGRGE